jgi:hypothetical protein
MAFERVDLSITCAAQDQIWVSALTRLGAVHSVPRNAVRDNLLDEIRSRNQEFRSFIKQGYSDPVRVDGIAQLMTDLVFGIPEVTSLFQRTRGAAADRRLPLLIRILAAPQEVAALPWELILDPEGGTHRHLTLAPDAHLVRLARVRTYPDHRQAIVPPIRMLLILASPPLLPEGQLERQFDIYEAKRYLLEELNPLVQRGLMEVDTEDRPTIENLRSRIARRDRGYDIVHFIGNATSEGLFLEDANGREVTVPPEKFAELLRGCPDLSLVVFGGCETAQSPTTDRATQWPEMLSISELVVRDACPVVIGMQAVIPVRAERVFTQFLYRTIAGGRSIADAVAVARAAIRDDPRIGDHLLDWAVPSIFVGGESASAVVDPAAPSKASRTTTVRPKRVDLKLDLVEAEREFFARHLELRQAIDYLAGRTRWRILWITGPPGVGKTSLVDRALEDIDEHVALVFYVRGKELADVADPVRSICEQVSGLLFRRDGKRRKPDANLDGIGWWSWLIEEIVDLPAAIVLDDVDRVWSHENVRTAIRKLGERRTQARFVLIADERRYGDGILAEGDQRVRTIRVPEISWPEMWRWLRRNEPRFANRFDSIVLANFFSALGPHVELWKELADESSREPDAKLSVLVERITQRTIRRRPSDETSETVSVRASVSETSSGLQPTPVTGLRVACAGPYYAGHEREFAAAITALAVEHGVAGRISGIETPNVFSPTAILLPLESPFDESGGISNMQLIADWLYDAARAGANVILADFGAPKPSKPVEAAIDQLAAQGILIVAAGGNDKAVTYPAWNANVLAVGALDGDTLAPYSTWDHRAGKPDVFAEHSVADTALRHALSIPDATGSSIAAYRALAAAVLVWISDLTLTAAQVRAILVESATPFKHGKLSKADWPRRLDLDGALNLVRERAVAAALSVGPLDLESLIAASGLGVDVTAPVIDRMASSAQLEMAILSGKETYSMSESLRTRVKDLLPSGPGS